MQLLLHDLPASRRCLIGISGGRDSVALLHTLHQQGYTKLIVCHINHRLRGRASGQDAAFVQRLATRLGYACEVATVDVTTFARTSRQSIETAAREARHAFFAAMARKHRCPRVLLAHHADDQAETVLMRILRGTGIGGLSGMRPTTQLQVGNTSLTLIRPLLHTRRADIDAFVSTHRLAYREDASNLDPTPARNRLRLALLPQISEAIGRDAAPMLLRLSQCAALDDDLLRQLTETLIHEASLIGADGTLSLSPALKTAHPALRHRVIHHWLHQHRVSDLDASTITAVARLMDQRDPSRINLAQGLQVRRKSGRLSVASQSPARPV